ncbi:MAG: PHP domain-containing protein [Clostridia bacterium]|nr:PHP domain-containing protein [Clostridia bacterium]
MKVHYDFHIHSCLSPCGDDDMTPNNIVNMSLIKGLDVIAITDHNTMKNCPSAVAVGEEVGLLVIPGMEIQTREDVHVVVLFPSVAIAASFELQIDAHRLMLPHKPDKFGRQLIMSTEDEIIEEYPVTLLASVDIGVDQILDMAIACGGVAFPAHINKHANSVLDNLGFIPEGWPIGAVEIFQPDKNEALLQTYTDRYKILTNSDAHYLQDISEPVNVIEIPELTIDEIIKYLRKT